jgi:hypothetical protein
MSEHLLIPPISLLSPLPSVFPTQRFKLGQWVFWANVPAQDCGQVVGIFWASESSVVMPGFHYAVLLHHSNGLESSVLVDWAAEQDLKAFPPLS